MTLHHEFESEMEEVRKSAYPDLPSRLSSTYAVDSQFQVQLLRKRYSNWKTSNLYVIQTDSEPYHRFNMDIIKLIQVIKRDGHLSEGIKQYLIDSYFTKQTVVDINLERINIYPEAYSLDPSDGEYGRDKLIWECLLPNDVTIVERIE